MADIKDHFTFYLFIQQIFTEFLDVFWGWNIAGNESWSLLCYIHIKKNTTQHIVVGGDKHRDENNAG